MSTAQITTKDLSRKGTIALMDRIDAATPAERDEIRRQIEALKPAKATGHGGSARQAGSKAALLNYLGR